MLTEVCGKHGFVNHPDLATFFSHGRGGEEGFGGSGVAVVSTMFLREGSHLARRSGLRFPSVQLAAAGRQQPENWLLPQGGLGDAPEWCRAARRLSAKFSSGGRGLTL